MTLEEYFKEVARYMDAGDTLTCDLSDDNDTIIYTFSNLFGCTLSTYNAKTHEYVKY